MNIFLFLALVFVCASTQTGKKFHKSLFDNDKAIIAVYESFCVIDFYSLECFINVYKVIKI